MAKRRAEFDALFGTSFVSQEREPLQLHLKLAVPQDAESPVRDLFQREHECCPFFSFSFRRERDSLIVTVRVLERAEAALDGFSQLAADAAHKGAH